MTTVSRRVTRGTKALALVALFCLVADAPLTAQQQAQQHPGVLTATEAMIPTRDGVHLYTQIYAPTQALEKLPILLLRTPYGTGPLNAARIASALPELTADGYIIVSQDIRGRFKSEGQFVMLRQPRDPKDKNAIDESTDTYDTIEWLLKNVPNTTAASEWRARATARGLRSWARSIRILRSRPQSSKPLQRICGSEMTFITMAHSG